MSKIKIISSIAVALIVISSIAAYIILPTWQQRAAHNLDAIHHAIDEMHPAVLEPDATAFHEWHTKGYEQAKALLPLVKSPVDENALLRFYFTGYQDPHLYFISPPQHFAKNLYQKSNKWVGWILKSTNAGYKVVYSLSDKGNPPVGMQLIRCDGQEIDGFLKDRFAPYLDRRWYMPLARDLAAKSLAIDRDDTSVLNRPDVKQCEFLDSSGTTLAYPVRWQALTKEQAKKIDGYYQVEYSLPSVREFAPKSYWITLSDFSLATKGAYESQQHLVRDLAAITDADTIVLDVRANGGGDARYGFDALCKLLMENCYFLQQKFNQKDLHDNAEYRVSQFTLWSEEALLTERKKTQGNTSRGTLALDQIVTHFREALKQGKTHLLASEISGGKSSNYTLPKQEWSFKGKVILLTSSRCVSACLDFVDVIKFIPNLLHVGEPTNADTVYSQVAYMREQYVGEQVDFMVPIMKSGQRLRQDNVPYVPDAYYYGDMNDTASLEKWILQLVNSH
ncbi:MAG: S41 family peptidase [Steroidobacter sp.]